MGPPSGARRIPGPGASPCRWSDPHAGLQGPPLVWIPIHIFRDSLDSLASSRLWCSTLRPPPVRDPPRPPCRTALSFRLERPPLCQDPAPRVVRRSVGSHTPASGGRFCVLLQPGWCLRGALGARPPVRLPPRPRCGVPQCSRGHCGGARLGLFVGWEKSRQRPDSNPRPPDPQPSILTTRTRELDASEVCIFIPLSARGASSSRRLERGPGRRQPRGRTRSPKMPKSFCGIAPLRIVPLELGPFSCDGRCTQVSRIAASSAWGCSRWGPVHPCVDPHARAWRVFQCALRSIAALWLALTGAGGSPLQPTCRVCSRTA